jgi:hypothetical protein
MATLKLHCDICATVRSFEQPACTETHGTDCPEWACTTCGAAILQATPIMLVDRRPRVILEHRQAPAKHHRRTTPKKKAA